MSYAYYLEDRSSDRKEPENIQQYGHYVGKHYSTGTSPRNVPSTNEICNLPRDTIKQFVQSMYHGRVHFGRFPKSMLHTQTTITWIEIGGALMKSIMYHSMSQVTCPSVTGDLRDSGILTRSTHGRDLVVCQGFTKVFCVNICFGV